MSEYFYSYLYKEPPSEIYCCNPRSSSSQADRRSLRRLRLQRTRHGEGRNNDREPCTELENPTTRRCRAALRCSLLIFRLRFCRSRRRRLLGIPMSANRLFRCSPRTAHGAGKWHGQAFCPCVRLGILGRWRRRYRQCISDPDTGEWAMPPRSPGAGVAIGAFSGHASRPEGRQLGLARRARQAGPAGGVAVGAIKGHASTPEEDRQPDPTQLLGRVAGPGRPGPARLGGGVDLAGAVAAPGGMAMRHLGVIARPARRRRGRAWAQLLE